MKTYKGRPFTIADLIESGAPTQASQWIPLFFSEYNDHKAFTDLYGVTDAFDSFKYFDGTSSMFMTELYKLAQNSERIIDNSILFTPTDIPVDTEHLYDIVKGWAVNVWLRQNAYWINTLYSSISQEYNPVYNYDRFEERELNREGESSDSTVFGARSYTKGAQTNSQSDSTTIDGVTDSWQTNAHTDETTLGATQDTHQHGAHVDEHRESVAPFTTANAKPRGSSWDEYQQYSDIDSTLEHTDSTEYGLQAGTETKGARGSRSTSSITEGQRADSEATHTDSRTGSSSGTDTESLHAYGNIGVTTAMQMLKEQRDIACFSLMEEIYKKLFNDMCMEVML